MAKDLIMPKLGAEMTVGKIVEWKKKEGAWVNKGEIVVVIETDKITFEVESTEAGFLFILKGTDEEIPISVVIGLLCESKEERESWVLKGGKVEEPVPRPLGEPSASKIPASVSVQADLPRQEVRISPLARKLAKESGLDIAQIQGTGPGGRIEKQDVQRVLEGRQKEERPLPSEKGGSPLSARKTVKQVVPLRGMRKVIAQRLYGSLQQMAQFTDMGEMDVTETVHFRKKLLEQADVVAGKVSYNDLLVKIVALVLKEVPIMNASVVGEEIHLWNEVNIGVAVSLEEGLVVPVVRDADKKAVVEVHRDLEDLVGRARSRKLTPDEISGGTFTLSNFGSYGAYYGTPIINPPEVALLGVGVIRQVPVVVNDEIVIRWSMSYGLTMDHRVMDGAVGGRFIQRVREILGNPYLLKVM